MQCHTASYTALHQSINNMPYKTQQSEQIFL